MPEYKHGLMVQTDPSPTKLQRQQRWLRIGFASIYPYMMDHVIADLDLKFFSNQTKTIVIPLTTRKLSDELNNKELDLHIKITIEVKRA